VQLQPVYGDHPILAVDLPSTGPIHPVVAQRRRLQATLADLSEDEWAAPSRCEAWTVQDVITHLVSTNQFWGFSVAAGLGGEPTRFLATFDPVASPQQLVQDAGAMSPAETLAAFTESSEQFLTQVEALDEAGFAAVAEAPPGHVPIARLADHALWDSWIHERDILLPLGRVPVVEADEVRASLRYGATLGPAFAASQGTPTPGRVVVEASAPDERFTVDVVAGQAVVRPIADEDADAPVLRGDAVDLVEQLALRDVGRPTVAELAWLTGGLAVVFDQSVEA
jgi:uncharacterized protein (TIGR03083 family)